jgi:hypothetical protein
MQRYHVHQAIAVGGGAKIFKMILLREWIGPPPITRHFSPN